MTNHETSQTGHPSRRPVLLGIAVLIAILVGVTVFFISMSPPSPTTVVTTVQVTGKLIPPNKVDVVPKNLTFARLSDSQKFVVNVSGGQYSVILMNHASYNVTLTWAMAGSSRFGVANIGTLKLDSNSSSYTFDVNW